MNHRMTTESAWFELSGDLRRFIRRKVSDDHLAEDLLQETFIRIHKNIHSLQQQDRFAAWVFQICRNVITDHFRGKKSHEPIHNEQCAGEDEGTDRLRANASKWLAELIGQLPEKYRVAIQLSEIEGLSQQEVADQLCLSLSGAKSRIQRGRVGLKQVLEQCCTLHLDHRGKLMDCDPLPNRTVCLDCEE
jgi:RNA polymerase sigma-70 factor (ECF subfamily)